MRDEIKSAVLSRILQDKNKDGETDLLEILGELKGNKGHKKPTGADNPHFTVHTPPSNVHADSTAENGTIIINCFMDNYPSGVAKTSKLDAVGQRLKELFHDNPLSVDGIVNYNLVVNSIVDDLWDPEDPDESYCSVRLGYNIIKK